MLEAGNFGGQAPEWFSPTPLNREPKVQFNPPNERDYTPVVEQPDFKPRNTFESDVTGTTAVDNGYRLTLYLNYNL